MNKGPFKVMLLSGSPDQTNACNRLLQHLKTSRMVSIELVDAGVAGLPVFTGTINTGILRQLHPIFTALKQADAVLLIYPEQNGSVSTYLKNLIDHTSIPYGCNYWLSKPVAAVCCAEHSRLSPYVLDDLLRLLRFIGADIELQDTIAVARARTLFNADGVLVDKTLHSQLQQLLQQLIDKVSARMAVRHPAPDLGIPLWNSWY